MGCSESFDDCFCVSMGTNKSDDYDLSIDRQNDGSFLINCRDSAWAAQLDALGAEKQDVTPAFVTENKVRVTIPDNLSHTVAESSIWDEYDSRCIACGRCNFVCPSCTCFTMQEHFLQRKRPRRRTSSRLGQLHGRRLYRCRRRRQLPQSPRPAHAIQGSAQSARPQSALRPHNVRRLRRCDAICPEYISFSHAVNRLGDAMKEVNAHD